MPISAPTEVDQRHHGRHRQGAVQQAQPARDGVHTSAEMGGHRRNAAPVKQLLAKAISTFLGVLFVNYCIIEPHPRLKLFIFCIKSLLIIVCV